MASAARLGALAGSAGGLATVLAGQALRPLIGLPALPDLLQDRLVKLTPGAVFGLLIDRLQYAGRPLLYSSLLLLELVVLTIIGALAVALEARRMRRVDAAQRTPLTLRVLALAAAVWLLVGLVAMPLAGIGPFALGSRFNSGLILWGYALEALLYSLVTWLVLAGLTQPAPARVSAGVPDNDPLRRGVTAGVAVATLATLSGVAFWRYRGELAGEADVTTPTPDQPLLTPTDAFYVVSKNLDDPVVKADSWRLSVKGLVQKPLTLDYAALTALPSVEQYRTLECISNDVGGSLMSTARWRGVPLAKLLDQAGADTAAPYVLFAAVDDYTESIPMAIARQPTTLIAYQMNGAPLPAKHGFPARVILAGRYGMKNPKWLTAITIAKADEPGFWEQQGWDEAAVVRTTSRIDAPADGSSIPNGTTIITGVAYAGDRGISAAQVQISPSQSWQDATLQPINVVSTWTAWSFNWTPSAAGTYHISVRATDGSGAMQSAKAQDSFPLGAAGLHTITVQVG